MKKTKIILLISLMILQNFQLTFGFSDKDVLDQCLSPKHNTLHFKSLLISKAVNSIISEQQKQLLSMMEKSWQTFINIQQSLKRDSQMAVKFFNLIDFKEDSKLKLTNWLSELFLKSSSEIGVPRIRYSRIFYNLDGLTYEAIIECIKNDEITLLKIKLRYDHFEIEKNSIKIETISNNQLTEVKNKIILDKKIKEYYETHSKKIKTQINDENSSNFASWRHDRKISIYNNMLGLKRLPLDGEAPPLLEEQVTKKFLERLLRSDRSFKKSSRFKILEIGSGEGIAIQELKEIVIKNVLNELQNRISDRKFLNKWGFKKQEEFINQLNRWIQINGLSLTPYKFSREVIGSACEIPWEDDSFDVVISIAALMYIPDVQVTINEILRVSRDNALILCDHFDKKIEFNRKKTKLWEIFTDFLTPLNEYIPSVLIHKKNNIPNKTVEIIQVIQSKEDKNPDRYDQYQKLIFFTDKHLKKIRKFSLSFVLMLIFKRSA